MLHLQNVVRYEFPMLVHLVCGDDKVVVAVQLQNYRVVYDAVDLIDTNRLAHFILDSLQLLNFDQILLDVVFELGFNNDFRLRKHEDRFVMLHFDQNNEFLLFLVEFSSQHDQRLVHELPGIAKYLLELVGCFAQTFTELLENLVLLLLIELILLVRYVFEDFRVKVEEYLCNLVRIL